MSENTQEPEPLTAESILAAYRVSDKPIEVLLPDGRKMRFSPLPTTRVRREMDKRIDALMEEIPGVEDKGHSRHFLRKMPELEYADVKQAAEIHLRALFPAFTLEQACGLHYAPTVVAHIEKRLNEEDQELLTLYYRNEAEKAKGKSSTAGSGDGSPLAEGDSPDDIPTT